MFNKDRYSHAFILFIAGVALSLFLFRLNNKVLAAIALVASVLYIAYLFLTKARLHLSDQQMNSTGVAGPVLNMIEVKTEDGCDFSSDKKNLIENRTIHHIDGIRIGKTGKRYKAVNGADVYLGNDNMFYPTGFGSYFMQQIGGGGYEPESIQTDKCWN